MSQKILTSLFAQKSWANRELFDVLASVTSTEHAAALHTAIRTLNHIYVVDRIFRAHLAGEKHPYTATNTPETPDWASFISQSPKPTSGSKTTSPRSTDPALAQSLAFQFTDGDAGRMTREEMLFHVLTHGSYHRGNVGQVLKGISVAPPRDLLTKFLHVSEPSRRQG